VGISGINNGKPWGIPHDFPHEIFPWVRAAESPPILEEMAAKNRILN